MHMNRVVGRKAFHLLGDNVCFWHGALRKTCRNVLNVPSNQPNRAGNMDVKFLSLSLSLCMRIHTCLKKRFFLLRWWKCESQQLQLLHVVQPVKLAYGHPKMSCAMTMGQAYADSYPHSQADIWGRLVYAHHAVLHLEALFVYPCKVWAGVHIDWLYYA